MTQIKFGVSTVSATETTEMCIGPHKLRETVILCSWKKIRNRCHQNSLIICHKQLEKLVQ